MRIRASKKQTQIKTTQISRIQSDFIMNSNS